VEESVELATILLTDLVGSTRLANSVGPVRAIFEPRAAALAAQSAAEA
jgi:class 3 adenylate cyclase